MDIVDITKFIQIKEISKCLILQKYKGSSNKFNNANLFSDIKFPSFSFHDLDDFIINMQLQDYYYDLEKTVIDND